MEEDNENSWRSLQFMSKDRTYYFAIRFSLNYDDSTFYLICPALQITSSYESEDDDYYLSDFIDDIIYILNNN